MEKRRERTTREEKKKGNRYLNRSGIKMDRSDGKGEREGERKGKATVGRIGAEGHGG